MKKTLYILGTVVFATLAVSCLDDKDKKADKTLDHVVSVEGIPTTEETLFLDDYLELEPEITISEGSSVEDYTYRWTMATMNLGEEKNLNWHITLPPGYTYNESITGVFIVRNEKTELEYRKTFSVKIQNTLAPNWLAVYETPAGNLEWMSMQGTPEEFTRIYSTMNELVNGSDAPLTGGFRGAMEAKDELMIFTDENPGYGYCISLRSGKSDIVEIGEVTGNIRGSSYLGDTDILDFRDIRYPPGGTRFLTMNDNLYVWNGTSSNLPVFDDQTNLKATDVAQVMSSKHFVRYKKAVLIRYSDNTLGIFHAYNLAISPVYDEDGELLELESVHGMFAESTSLATNNPYNLYIIGETTSGVKMYEYFIDNPTGQTVFQPPVWVNTIDIPTQVASSATNWWGAYAQKYGFYSTKNEIYKFDYLTYRDSFNSSRFKYYDSKYEIIGVYPINEGNTMNNRDYGTMVYLYDAAKNTTSMHFFQTVSGDPVSSTHDGFYEDVIPGRGVEFFKRTVS